MSLRFIGWFCGFGFIVLHAGWIVYAFLEVEVGEEQQSIFFGNLGFNRIPDVDLSSIFHM